MGDLEDILGFSISCVAKMGGKKGAGESLGEFRGGGSRGPLGERLLGGEVDRGTIIGISGVGDL
jgi:hypothetical protein